MYPFWKYHVELTSCELKFGFSTAVTAMTIPMADILSMRPTYLRPGKFFGFGVRFNGSHWGYIGKAPGMGIEVVVKPQGAGWLGLNPKGPQTLFFSCNNTRAFLSHFETIRSDHLADDAVDSEKDVVKEEEEEEAGVTSL